MTQTVQTPEMELTVKFATGARDLPVRWRQIPQFFTATAGKVTLLNSLLRTCFCQACRGQRYNAGSLPRQDEIDTRKREA